jgi:ADP-ribosylglycohydrolase
LQEVPEGSALQEVTSVTARRAGATVRSATCRRALQRHMCLPRARRARKTAEFQFHGASRNRRAYEASGRGVRHTAAMKISVCACAMRRDDVMSLRHDSRIYCEPAG